MGLNIIVPVVLVAVVVPIAFAWARKRFKEGASGRSDDPLAPSSDRLTSAALRSLDSPPWRIVYEIAPERLSGIGHVAIGPAGIFAIRTSMEPLPSPASNSADAQAVGAAAIARGGLDDALRSVGMASDRLVVVNWGRTEAPHHSVETLPAVTAVDGRRIGEWANSLAPGALTPSQVDLAWQAVLKSIGRPDPLA